MSAITHEVAFTCGDRRNSSADANACVTYPSDRTSRFVATRTDASSSMIEITGTWLKTVGPFASVANPRSTSTFAPSGGVRKSYLGLRAYAASQQHAAISLRALGVYPRARSLRLCATHSERLGHSHQVGQRPRPHLLHHAPAVDLHRDLGEIDLGGDLLVHEAGGDQGQDLLLARGERLETSLKIVRDLLAFAPLAITLDRRRHRIQHVLVAKRLAQEIDRSGLHGPHGHRDVAVAGHEDDRDMNVRLGQLGLKVEAARPRQPDVEDQTARSIGELALQEFRRRAEHLHAQAYRAEEIRECVAQRRVVVDDEYDRLRAVRPRRTPRHDAASRNDGGVK